MKSIYSIAAAAMLFTATSCVDDLDVKNIDPNVNSETTAEMLFNKCYATLGLQGQSGPSGDCDLDGGDGGTAGVVRQLINSQCLTTDEMICCWTNDGGIVTYNNATYTASQEMLRAYYYRLYFGVTLYNSYLADFGGYDPQMTAEVRFLRALHFFYLMDGWGNVPMPTEVSTSAPKQATTQEVYDFIESELLDCVNDLADAKPSKFGEAGYGRANKAAAWLLLARLYLGAEVYTGTAQWAKAQEYAKKVMDSDFSLNVNGANGWSAYQMLFMGDNGESSAANEIILPVLQDGATTQAWCTSLFCIASTFSDDMYVRDPDVIGGGTTEKWGGNRCRRDLIAKFFNGDPTKAPENSDYSDFVTAAGDDRALFFSKDRTLDIDENNDFKKGYATVKFVNFRSDGLEAHNTQFVDMDYPLMRKAEAYLIYAETFARLNGGNCGTGSDGLAAINKIRARANASQLSSANLDDICDEWSREFYFEGFRRTTLIRFNRFGGDTGYTWQWKGGSYNGTTIPAFRNLFPIPETDLNANSNLVQNPGY